MSNTAIDGFYEETSRKLVTSITLAEEIQRTKVKLAAILLIQNRIYYNGLGFWQEDEDYFTFLVNEITKFVSQKTLYARCDMNKDIYFETTSIDKFIEWVIAHSAALYMVTFTSKHSWDGKTLKRLPLICTYKSEKDPVLMHVLKGVG